jgi:hypothetical protein
MGVRGTAGSTTTPSRKRETSIFNTPTVVRPPSALSDSSEDGVGKKTANTPIPIKRSQRASGSTVQPHPCHEGGEPNRGFNGCSFAFSCSESFRGRRNSFPTTLCSFAFRLDKPLAFYVNAEACYSPAHGFGLRSCDPGSSSCSPIIINVMLTSLGWNTILPGCWDYYICAVNTKTIIKAGLTSSHCPGSWSTLSGLGGLRF